MLWTEAAAHEFGTPRAVTHFSKTNNPAAVVVFMSLHAKVRFRLLDCSLAYVDTLEPFLNQVELEPIPLLMAPDLDHALLASKSIISPPKALQNLPATCCPVCCDGAAACGLQSHPRSRLCGC
jgi:hypothetical protein